MFQWRDFLELATRLAHRGADEAELRTAISRAYYAAYHGAAAYVRAQHILTSGHSHTRVWQALANDPDPARADIGVRGVFLKRSREYADYRHPFPGALAEEAEAAILEARAIVAAIDRLV